MEWYDIAIIGAGPAGSSAALALKDSKANILVCDKDQFPRPKICGDGLCDRSINVLRALSDEYYQEFISEFNPLPVKKTSLVYKGKHHILSFKNFGYTCKREEFDAFLYTRIQRDCPHITLQNTEIRDVETIPNGIRLTDSQGNTYNTHMLIVANGAKSHIAAKLQNKAWKKEENGVAVRAYYENVADLTPDTIELHYAKKYFPGYFWVFPIGENMANVGFGYHMKDSSIQQESIQNIFHEWIQNDPHLRARFSEARMVSSLQGGLIPYNKNDFSSTGDSYIITGDAASLIDPISGGGIGSAMLSGYLAAKTAQDGFEAKNYSYEITKQYEQLLTNRIEKEIRVRNKLQNTISNQPWLLDVLAFAAKSSRLLQKISAWYLR